MRADQLVKHLVLETVVEIRDSYEHWNNVAANGCGDPFWEDGANMNLIRNRIIYLKGQLTDQAKKEMPSEFYWAVPPEVPNTYMAKNGKYFSRCRNWDEERRSRIVFSADTDMALF